MPYDPSTYTPGSPWTGRDFISRAITTPKIVKNLYPGGGNDATTGSYFEHRASNNKATPTINVGITAPGSGTFTVQLQASYDDGATWIAKASYSAATSTSVDVEPSVMYRLFLSAQSGLNSSNYVIGRLIQEV